MASRLELVLEAANSLQSTCDLLVKRHIVHVATWILTYLLRVLFESDARARAGPSMSLEKRDIENCLESTVFCLWLVNM